MMMMKHRLAAPTFLSFALNGVDVDFVYLSKAHDTRTFTTYDDYIYTHYIEYSTWAISWAKKVCVFVYNFAFFLLDYFRYIYIYYICCVRCTDWERAVFIRYSLIGYIYMLCWCVCIELTCAADSLYAFGYEAAWRIGFRIVWFAMGRRQRANRFRLETIYKYMYSHYIGAAKSGVLDEYMVL